MKKVCIVFAALSGLLLATPAVQAEVENVPSDLNTFVSAGGTGPALVIPHRAFPAKTELDPVMRPPSIDPTMDPPGESSRSAASKAGPSASLTDFSSAGSALTSGALLTPRGSAISTPRQQADRAVQRVIRRLD